MSEGAPCEDWPGLLEACVKTCALFRNATVVRETETTQDIAVRMGAQPGDVVTTFRQTAGRGRLGRAWADTGAEGVAITLVVEGAPPERLAIASAIGIARAAETCLAGAAPPQRIGIRWPNDIVVATRKLAGILVEQDDRTARIGVGMNVRQQTFPSEIAGRACSLAQFGAALDRTEALIAIITSMDAAMGLTDDVLRGEFAARDVLRGCVATFQHDRQIVTGRVVDIDPMRGLRVASEAGEIFLPACATSLVHVEAAAT